MSLDIAKILDELTKIEAKINSILPAHWKGNWEPDPHHFDPGSIQVHLGVDIPGQAAVLSFAYLDNAVAHTIEARFGVQSVTGKAKAHIVVDGIDAGEGQVNWGAVAGIGDAIPPAHGTVLYDRIKVEFVLADGRKCRFDGDVA